MKNIISVVSAVCIGLLFAFNIDAKAIEKDGQGQCEGNFEDHFCFPTGGGDTGYHYLCHAGGDTPCISRINDDVFSK